MLLYTRRAQPKVPKRRSRAGCAYCKEKKKKCDETRPQCGRCKENDQVCAYGPVRPRQRRRKEAVTSAASETQQPGAQSPLHRQLVDEQQYEEGSWTPVPAHTDEDYVFPWTPGSIPPLSPPPAERGVVYPNRSFNDDDDGDDEEVEEIVRQDPYPAGGGGGSDALARAERSPSLAMIAPVPVYSPRLEFCAPAFAEFSDVPARRMLVNHFCSVLSHLIVFREEDGNPWQKLVLPLTQGSPTVTNSMYALASAHLEFRGVGVGEKSIAFHQQAIQGLARMIENGGGQNRNELLAAIIMLVYYEVLVQRGCSNIVDGHLKGAMTILNQSPSSASDATSVFLERAFRFYDVIAALSFGKAPLSFTSGGNILAPFVPLDSRGAASPVGSVDALLGMATPLWPIIHRLSTLLSLRDEIEAAAPCSEAPRSAMLRAEFETSAEAVENALNRWEPDIPQDSILALDPRDIAPDKLAERSRMQSILSNALAYRHAAFVYLYRTIYSYTRSHPLVQRHTHTCLIHCAGVTNNVGPMGALLWPLFVASCEAMDLEDRDLAQQAFLAIDRRQGMTNIERAWTVVREVWSRADQEELLMQQAAVSGQPMGRQPGDLWRKVTEELGFNIVFG